MKLKLLTPLNTQKLYIISVSGGVDSMALLDYLFHRKIPLIVVHFNHLMREEAILDKELVFNYCQTKNIPFHYFELDLPKKDFQNQASLFRKKRLKEIAVKYETRYCLTAHHLDDLAETIFLKMIRGSSLLGYSGVQPSYREDDIFFLKPFLYLPKEELIRYAVEKKIPFLEDRTNGLNIYTRNKIRNQIIPLLKEERHFLKNMEKFHQQTTEAHDFIRSQSRLFLSQQTLSEVWDLEAFLLLHIAVQKDILLTSLEDKKISKNFTLINNIIKGLQNRYKPNAEWDLNNEWFLIKQYDQLLWQKKILLVQENLVKPLLYGCVEPKLLSFCQEQKILFYDEGKIKFPLVLKQKRDGDMVKFPFGTQKLKKFLINKKIPLSKRKKLWLVVDQNNTVLWIPHLYINQTLGKTKTFNLGINSV
ncbi:tRNA lysidine(34) synthetase TilS [Candidatus Phytoplasma pruni]|uniref:tRNA lysidine(34) synthetase TilS n=1 Tax=Candidatus Phytoplasma pruni TaxID=479893 RepID=UPI0006AC412E|nr:tRNA lysidine(34) synthetase TilS [Candidatus Phytoplasma pruni]MDW3617648.1 tRNA lysidine(34) synthetase TilS [Candidatus Phytoplasma pruni]